MHRFRVVMICCCLMLCGMATAQQDSLERARADSLLVVELNDGIKSFFSNYVADFATRMSIDVESYNIDTLSKRLEIFANEGFSSQVFTPQKVVATYEGMRKCLPEVYRQYNIIIYAFGREISTLIPNDNLLQKDTMRLWNAISYQGNEWTRNMSRPIDITKGLQGHHIALWPSHGRYYDHSKATWRWQRPNLYCTNEDLFTRSIVVPFLMPMLERAGAVVYCPRERDEHREEIIVDNDTTTISQAGVYQEIVGQEAVSTCTRAGFAQLRNIYVNENPHQEGSARQVRTVSDTTALTIFRWQPQIPSNGEYAVYVCYPTVAQSVTDARYVICHGGISTTVRVNQRMGGSTWVYLGTFGFTSNREKDNYIQLSNLSDQQGVITADAIRIGGGMGNVERGRRISGYPRYLEGSRYWAQWAGMPNAVYNTKDGRNDYADDINVRSNSLNYIAGGSVYEPGREGLQVPMELSLAIHSDAGWATNDSVIGTLSIYTINGDDGTDTMLSGMSRMACSDLAAMVQNSMCRDLSAICGRKWVRRELYNRNYSESRKPEVPSMILETLSHQNFLDMLYGHDPIVKFVMARSIYKAAARFIAQAHGEQCVIQPLPPRAFVAQALKGEARLSWEASVDSLEPSAQPDEYIVYMAREGEDFSNGMLVADGQTSITIPIEQDKVYRFKVAACNQGGESFPSEVLSVLSGSEEKYKVMVCNAFTRLSSPAVISTPDSLGFDIASDIGVPYISTAEYCGAQTGFNRANIGRETAGGLGYSGTELEGRKIAGNSFDYTSIHALAIRDDAHMYSVSSCSREAMELSDTILNDIDIVDVIMGLQKDDGISSVLKYESFTSPLQHRLYDFKKDGGNIIVSGAYISSDMQRKDEQHFTSKCLGYTHYTSLRTVDPSHYNELINSDSAISYNAASTVANASNKASIIQNRPAIGPNTAPIISSKVAIGLNTVANASSRMSNVTNRASELPNTTTQTPTFAYNMRGSAPALHTDARAVYGSAPTVCGTIPIVSDNTSAVHTDDIAVYGNSPTVCGTIPIVSDNTPAVHTDATVVYGSAPNVPHNTSNAHVITANKSANTTNQMGSVSLMQDNLSNMPAVASYCGNIVALGSTRFSFYSDFNADNYAVQSVDALKPNKNAVVFMTYDNGLCAAVSTYSSVALGFPFEAIKEPQMRKIVMNRILQSLLLKM